MTTRTDGTSGGSPTASANAVRLAPWAARNCVTLDRCAMVSTNAGINLYIGALDEALRAFQVFAERSALADL